MKRLLVTPRPNWQQKCNEVGFTFYDAPSENSEPYWRESVAYEFTLPEIEQIERETEELFELCLQAVEFIVTHDRFAEFAIPEPYWPAVKASWQNDDPTVFGRFDLAYTPGQPSKLLEFNADTPTSLVESAAAQWFWMKEAAPDGADQFNSIHEQLIAQWSHIRTQNWRLPIGAPLYLASLHNSGDGQLITEDYDNVAYMAETAKQAGFSPRQIFLESVQWNNDLEEFTDEEGRPIRHIYKLYPWEWLANEQYGPHILTTKQRTKWVEPLWKMLLSNKQLLVVLWELFPDHPLLLPAFDSETPLEGTARVRKPKLAREGANVQILASDGAIQEEAPGNYGHEGVIWQAYQPLPAYDGWHPVIGSWVVGKTAAGIGIRETSGKITNNGAFFVPHYIVP